VRRIDVDDWNVVVTTRDGGFRRAIRFLGQLGLVDRTGMFNVLVMKVADVRMFLEDLRARWAESAAAPAAISRVTPVTRTFEFATPEEFEAKARGAALAFVPALAGKAFHVRFHRRGHKGVLSTPTEERFLDDALLEALRVAGTPGRITFDDPDAVIAVETVGNRAGLSVWGRDELRRFPFLHPD
jgi:tRNA(Ser,Leu) C12 N-acetylase TAN1